MDPEFTPNAKANPEATSYPMPASTSAAVPTILVWQDLQPNLANAYGTQVPMDVWIEHRASFLRNRYLASLTTPQRGAPMPAQGHTPLMAQQNTATNRIPAFPLIRAPRPAENDQRDYGEVRVPVLPNLCSHPPNDGYTRAYPRQAPTTTTTVGTPCPAPAPGPQLQCTYPSCQARCRHPLCQQNSIQSACAGYPVQPDHQCEWYYPNQQHGERNERDD